MKRRNEKKEKKKLYILILLLLTMTIGIGYAILSETLKINSTIEYNTMTWNVGFESAIDGGGTVESNPTISSDKKNVTISCNLGTSTASETCIAKATIKNGSTYDIKLDSNPDITYDSTYVNSVTVVWTDDSTNVKMSDTIGFGKNREVIITITTKELTKEMLPEDALSIPVTITMNWVEGDDSTTDIEQLGYERVELQLTKSAYYCTLVNYPTPPTLTTRNNYAEATNDIYFYATQVFTKETLPVGSIIEIASGWQYRAEGWDSSNFQNQTAAERSPNVTTQQVTVDEAWWGDYTARGFNIALKGASTDISGYTEEQINEVFKIYVPKSS